MPIHQIGYHPACWRRCDVPLDGSMSLRHAVNCARIAERGKLDFVFLADTASVRNLDNPAIAREREHEHVKLEPFTLLAALATATREIGLVGTASTTYNEPNNLAGTLATLDHISGGRAGWNIVTGFALDEALNFGCDAIAPSAERHARARASVIKLRGMLANARTPQSMVPLITAGYSEEANAFTAEVADLCYAAAPTLAEARVYYADLKSRLPAHGRLPHQLKVLPGLMPFIGRTRQEAQDTFDRLQEMIDPAVGIGMLALWNFPDLRGYDIDGPVPEVTVKAGRYAAFSAGLLERVKRDKPTIRQLYEIVAAGFWQFGCIGTPAMIADAMEEWFTTGAADGFNIQTPYLPGAAEEFVDLVIPELQRRGLFRREYERGTLRERLGLRAAVPA